MNLSQMTPSWVVDVLTKVGAPTVIAFALMWFFATYLDRQHQQLSVTLSENQAFIVSTWSSINAQCFNAAEQAGGSAKDQSIWKWRCQQSRDVMQQFLNRMGTGRDHPLSLDPPPQTPGRPGLRGA